MGTWGVGGFESDVALDWALEFEDADLGTGLSLIRNALNGDDDRLASAAAEMVIVINGHPVPDTDHLDEIVHDEDAQPLTEEEVAAQTEAQTRELGMAIAEAIGRPGEVFVFEETEVFHGTGSIRWQQGRRLEEDEDEDEGWQRDAPASPRRLLRLARASSRIAVAR